MNVCSPIALNAISSENELIVYIEMMRTGGQTKTGMKRKRRKKRSGISIRWDRKESKIDECRSNQCACTRTWAQQNRKKRPSTSLEMVFGGKKKHHQIGVYVLIENANTLKLKRSFFKYSNRYDIWHELSSLFLNESSTKNVPFFIMSCHLNSWIKKKRAKEIFGTKIKQREMVERMLIWTSTKEVSWTHFSLTDSDKLLNFNIWSTMRWRWC